jgi:hypothetical protein
MQLLLLLACWCCCRVHGIRCPCKFAPYWAQEQPESRTHTLADVDTSCLWYKGCVDCAFVQPLEMICLGFRQQQQSDQYATRTQAQHQEHLLAP